MTSDTGKWLIVIGGLIVLAGLIVYFLGDKLHWIGHLPGDIHVEKENFRFYFPLTTLILLNILLFAIIRIWNWLSR
ncbi:DUF2905 domain-containing protein [Mucilaginibacter robiniae]|uniref:DUF2905 domain-containing protein n=1 Tax=Mucilaginibacter robiniae TaxID=2728022 RepID=A0A7L5DZH7_9SPHI|nr:DUF2905 domain-containing protein [Mucilaginibacter robiniae]QJD96385.1 DUF2905 domain-containing protein [Mucilaginibacter robiniae]